MQKYGSKGLAIFQINNDGASQGTTPTTVQLMAWVDYYKAAGASGIDPKRRSSKFYYDGKSHDAPIYDRGKLHEGIVVPGPAIVLEMDSTTVVLPGHEAKVDAIGNLLINPSK